MKLKMYVDTKKKTWTSGVSPEDETEMIETLSAPLDDFPLRISHQSKPPLYMP